MSRKSDLAQGAASYPLPPRNLEALTTKVYPVFRKLIEWSYFSLDVEGTEHVPQSGPVIFVANHAGWFTLDTFFGGLVVVDHLNIDRFPGSPVRTRCSRSRSSARSSRSPACFPHRGCATPRRSPRWRSSAFTPKAQRVTANPSCRPIRCKSGRPAFSGSPSRAARRSCRWPSSAAKSACLSSRRFVSSSRSSGRSCPCLSRCCRSLEVEVHLPRACGHQQVARRHRERQHRRTEGASPGGRRRHPRSRAAHARSGDLREGIVRLSHLVKNPLG